MGECSVISWTEWPDNGYLGLSNGNYFKRDTSISECQNYGGGLLVYTDAPKLVSIVTGMLVEINPAWVSGGNTQGKFM